MRQPDLNLEGYLKRWWIIPRNKWFNIYLHKFVGSDDDRALHDHPWHSISICFSGELWEAREYPQGTFCHRIKNWLPYFRKATLMHRMILKSETAWTLFITGPVIREWGFRKRHGDRDWMKHDEFLATYGERK